MTRVHEPVLQQRIQSLLDDWDLSDGEREQLNTIRHRIAQQLPNRDVTMTDIERIVTSLHTETSFRDGFDHEELHDLLFNC